MSKRIVIIGGGFAGLLTARNLARRCRSDEKVFLVDKKPRFLFTPWLVDVLAGDLKIEAITHSINEIAKRCGFSFIQGTMKEAVRAEHRVIVETANGETSIGYDVLLLCQGARTAFYGIPGTTTCCMPLKVEEDVERIHLATQTLLSKGGGSVAVIGGGPTGVEAIFSLKRYAEKLTRENPAFNKVKLTYTLVQAAPQILPGLSTSLVHAVLTELKDAAIEISVGDPVAQVEDHMIITNSGRKISSDITVWAAGIEANKVAIEPEPENKQGYLVVDNYMRLDDAIFVAGDTASFGLKGATIPKMAQAAMQMSDVLTRNILSVLYGGDLKPFTIENKGFIITLGTTAVASLFHRFTIKSPLFMLLRGIFYRAKFKQIVG